MILGGNVWDVIRQAMMKAEYFQGIEFEVIEDIQRHLDLEALGDAAEFDQADNS